MSISFRQIRKLSNAQGRFKELVADYQRFLAEQVTVDNPDFKVKLRTMYSKLVYQDPHVVHKTKSLTTVFYMPFEPDAKDCIAMLNLNHNGRFCMDSSGKGHHGKWTANPQVHEGIDEGFGTSLYAEVDGTSTVVYIENFAKLQLSSAPYFSITARIYPIEITATDPPANDHFRTILSKADTTDFSGLHMGMIDNGTVGNGYAMAVTPDGRVRFTLQVSGIKYTVQTLANVIVPFDPPFPYDITVTCDQLNKRTIPASEVQPPGPNDPPETEPPLTEPLIAPRMEISVDNNFYALYTTAHLPFVDDGPWRRLRIGSAYSYANTHERYLHFKWHGGIQTMRIYNGRILTYPEIQNLHTNKLTITEMPIGAPALVGSMLIIDPSSFAGFDMGGFDEAGFEASDVEMSLMGFPGMDSNGFDPEGFDTLTLT